MTEAATRHLTAGLELLGRDEPNRAVFAFREANRLAPDSADVVAALGYALGRLHAVEQAAACYREALRLDPGHIAALTNLGEVLRSRGDLDGAERLFARALETEPALVEALSNLALVRQSSGDPAGAEALLRRAIALRPGFPDAWWNLASALMDVDRVAEAAAAAAASVELAPNRAEGHWNLGLAHSMLGGMAPSIASFRRALALAPDSATLHWNYALALLAAGQWSEGWEEWEWRFRAGVAQPLPSGPPEWMGGDPAGRTILVRGEQGLGDTLMFLRYAQELARRGATVIVDVQPRLRELVALQPGISRSGEPTHQVSIGSLPRLLGTRVCSIPAQSPLVVPAALCDRWAAWLERFPRPRIGFCRSGNPAYKRNRLRSVPVGVEPGFPVVSLDLGGVPEADNLLDTAALVSGLDLVVTVDTMVAHLAGALGKPVRILLAHYADWRWLVGRGDSPWYPTARLLRQPGPGDWGTVLGNLQERLATSVSQRRR